MSYFSFLSDRRPDAAVAQALQFVIGDALSGNFKGDSFEGEWPRTGFGIANLQPRAVAASNQGAAALNGGVAGSSVWGVTAVTASTWTDWVNLTVDNRAYQVPIGIFNRTLIPHINNIKPAAAGQTLPRVDLEALYALEDQAYAYYSKPYSVGPAKNHTIRVLTDTTINGVPAERIGLLGYVVARQAYLITEST